MYDDESSTEPSGGQVELRRGRRGAPWTDVHDWVSLAPGVSPPAHSLYVKLRMHLNVERGGVVVWPGKIALALLMGFDKTDSLDRYVKQLEAVGAIDVDRRGLPAKCYYTLHDLPADAYCTVSGHPVQDDDWCKPCSRARNKPGATAQTDEPCVVAPFAGPMKLKDWYQANKDEIDRRRLAGKQERDARRKRVKGQVTSDTPSPGYPASDVAEGPSDTPHTGYPSAPQAGHPSAPCAGREQERSEQRRSEQDGGHTAPQTPLCPQGPTTSSPGNDQPSETFVRPQQPRDLQGDHRPRARGDAAGSQLTFDDWLVENSPPGRNSSTVGAAGVVRQSRVDLAEAAAGARTDRAGPSDYDHAAGPL